MPYDCRNTKRSSDLYSDLLRQFRDFDDISRIFDFKPQATLIDVWLLGGSLCIYPPSLLIVYPTYRCTRPGTGQTGGRVCPYCVYAKMLGEEDLDIDVAYRGIHDAVKMGTRNIQISGGGEPLQYRYLDQLLQVLATEKAAVPKLIIGLLTNGLYLTADLAKRITRLLSYVRFSYAESYKGDEQARGLFTANFARLLEIATIVPHPRVGLKLLLSHRNAGNLTDDLADLADILGPTLFNRVDHIRVKAMRSPNPRLEPTEEDGWVFLRRFCKFFASRKGCTRDIQVDIDLGYVGSQFRCRLTPLFGLIDPVGALMACYNYVDAYEDLRIGDLSSNSLVELWGGMRHREVASSLDVTRICNSGSGCPCRYVQYQRKLDNSNDTERPETPPHLTPLI